MKVHCLIEETLSGCLMSELKERKPTIAVADVACKGPGLSLCSRPVSMGEDQDLMAVQMS